jgi:amino acid permease
LQGKWQLPFFDLSMSDRFELMVSMVIFLNMVMKVYGNSEYVVSCMKSEVILTFFFLVYVASIINIVGKSRRKHFWIVISKEHHEHCLEISQKILLNSVSKDLYPL